MKSLLFFIFMLFVSMNINTYGQNSYIGKIIGMASPTASPDKAIDFISFVVLLFFITFVEYYFKNLSL